ncbi:uncharacterized protein [Nicotiana sylvestris]|uniref:uncharacterized protein n=1 Tax=Nicotiana sylvestris TaxID=4096 RepID=UPI00388C8D6C
MSVTDYEVRFSELSPHALMILPTDAERVRRFVAGLHSCIRANMARRIEMGTSYQLVVEIARGLRATVREGGEQMQQDTRARFSREFRGAPLGAEARPDALASDVMITGDSVVVDWIYRSYVVTFCGYETRADLLLLDMTDFEVILGMDWLSPYHAILDCHAKTITLAMLELLRLGWKGFSVSTSSQVISFLKARHMAEKGCLAYLAYVRDATTESLMIDSVPVVREFADLFPSEL